jgi:hypothetical protein
MRLRYAVNYNPHYAFVDGVFETGKGGAIISSEESWKNLAILKFCFNNKKVKVEAWALSVRLTKTDREFLETLAKIPASEYGIFRRIVTLMNEGVRKKEILEKVKTYAVWKRCLEG